MSTDLRQTRGPVNRGPPGRRSRRRAAPTPCDRPGRPCSLLFRNSKFLNIKDYAAGWGIGYDRPSGSNREVEGTRRPHLLGCTHSPASSHRPRPGASISPAYPGNAARRRSSGNRRHAGPISKRRRCRSDAVCRWGISSSRDEAGRRWRNGEDRGTARPPQARACRPGKLADIRKRNGPDDTLVNVTFSINRPLFDPNLDDIRWLQWYEQKDYQPIEGTEP
jgi:hypothetical protein